MVIAFTETERNIKSREEDAEGKILNHRFYKVRIQRSRYFLTLTMRHPKKVRPIFRIGPGIACSIICKAFSLDSEIIFLLRRTNNTVNE